MLKMFISVLWKLKQGTDTLFQTSLSVITYLRFFTIFLTTGTTGKYPVSMVITRLVMTTLEMAVRSNLVVVVIPLQAKRGR